MSMALTTNPADFDMAAILKENGVTLSANDFVRVKMPAGGATSWEIPDGDDTKPAKFIDGVILAKQPFRIYFENEYTGQKQSPACQSPDGRIGVGMPGGACATCPLNKWGSGRTGSGKACQEKLGIYVKVAGEQWPLMITLTPGSLASFNKYLTTLTMRGHLFYSIVTRFGLQKATNKGGLAFSQVTFTGLSKLDPDAFAVATQEKIFYTALVGQAQVMDDMAQGQLPGASDDAFTMQPDGSVITPNGLSF